MAVNYYTLLGLNVDTFVSDIPVLEKQLELMKQKWNRSNNTDIRAYVSAYYTSGVVKAAFSDKDGWRKIYEQAKRETDANIATFIMITSGKGFMYESELNACSSNKDIYATPEYVKKAALSQGVRIEPDAGKSTAKSEPAKKPTAKLSDYQPQSPLAFNAANKALGIVCCGDMYEFLRKYSKIAGLPTNIVYNEFTPADDCAKGAEGILKAWQGKKENDEKSAIDTICTVIKHFGTAGDKHSQENYNKSLIYGRLKAILDELWRVLSQSPKEQRIINSSTESMFVKRLTEVINDNAVSAAILRSFCEEKGIVINAGGAAATDRALCPFCSNAFEKPDGKMPMSCPVCRHTFLMECPMCHKVINYAQTDKCCGFDFGQYPKLSRMCLEALGFVNTLSFDFAELTLNEVEKAWPGFPEAKGVRESLKQKQSLVGQMVKRLDEHISRAEYLSAKAEYERIQKAVTGYSDPVIEMKVNSAVSEAQSLYAEYKRESDSGKKLRLLIRIKQITADHPGVDSELGNIPPGEISEFLVSADLNAGCVDLSWTSDDPEGTVEYEVRRKPFGALVSSDDGTLVVRTTEKGFSDRNVEEGMAYFYAVFAVRGRNKSKLLVCREPAVIFPTISRPPEINCDETMIQVSMEVKSGRMTAEVFRSANPLLKNYGDGMKIPDADSSGFVDTGLILGQKYYYNIFFSVSISGKRYISKPYSLIGQTVKKGMPVQIEIAADSDSKGRFELRITDGIEYAPQVQFYTSQSGSIASGRTATLKQLSDSFGMTRLSTVPSRSGSFSFDLAEGQSLYVYAVTVSGSVAVIGGCVYAENFRQLEVSSMRSDGVNLYIELEQWPQGQDMMYVCYRFDKQPGSINQQGNSKIAVNRLSYGSNGIVINNIEQKDYYITGFIRSAGEENPIFHTEYLNHRKLGITYDFSYTGLVKKQLKIRFAMSPPAPLPQLMLRGMMGAVPAYDTSGAELCVIPACPDTKEEHTFTLRGTINKNMHGKLFFKNPTDRERYQLFLKPGEKTLLTD